jgi:hypothetical protein
VTLRKCKIEQARGWERQLGLHQVLLGETEGLNHQMDIVRLTSGRQKLRLRAVEKAIKQAEQHAAMATTSAKAIRVFNLMREKKVDCKGFWSLEGSRRAKGCETPIHRLQDHVRVASYDDLRHLLVCLEGHALAS